MPTIHEDLKDFYRGYQGACPKKAKFLFIGLDANFPATMSKKLFDDVKEYLQDGPGFWSNNEDEVHHPFLLSKHEEEMEKKRAGKCYHERFQEIGFKACHAEQVSFLELLDYPTKGRSRRLKIEDLCDKHLGYLKEVITSKGKIVFIAHGVVTHMKKTGEFPCLFEDKPVSICGQKIKKLCEKKGTKIYKISHLSNPNEKYALGPAEMAKIGEIAEI